MTSSSPQLSEPVAKQNPDSATSDGCESEAVAVVGSKRPRPMSAEERGKESGGSVFPSAPSPASSRHVQSTTALHHLAPTSLPGSRSSSSLTSPLTPKGTVRVKSGVPPLGMARKSPLQLHGAKGVRPSPTSPSSAVSAAKKREEKWGNLLLPYLMIGRDESERQNVLAVCRRIAVALPGDAMEAQDNLMTLLVNLKDPLNSELRSRIVSGDLPVEVLVTMGEKELLNPERRRELEEGFKERSKDTNLVEIEKARQTTSTLFPCPACKVRDCSWVQRQTRSGDEPMTVICSCNQCGHQWRKY